MKCKTIFSVIVAAVLFVSCEKEHDQDQGSGDTTLLVDKTDQAYGTDAKQKFDIYIPQGHTTSATPVLFLIHGGGWGSGDKSDFTQDLPALKNLFSNYAIININYRLFGSGTNQFPVQEQDVKACIEHVLIHSTDYNISQRFGIIGMSTGAQLGMLYTYKYGNSSYKPKVVVDWGGPTDLIKAYSQLNSTVVKNWYSNVAGNPLTIDSLNYNNASPLRYVGANSVPTLILQGLADTITPYLQAQALRDKLQQLGVAHTYQQYPGERHNFSTVAKADAQTIMKTFINTHLY